MKKLRYLLAVLAFVGALAFLWQDPLASKTPAKAFFDMYSPVFGDTKVLTLKEGSTAELTHVAVPEMRIALSIPSYFADTTRYWDPQADGVTENPLSEHVMAYAFENEATAAQEIILFRPDHGYLRMRKWGGSQATFDACKTNLFHEVDDSKNREFEMIPLANHENAYLHWHIDTYSTGFMGAYVGGIQLMVYVYTPQHCYSFRFQDIASVRDTSIIDRKQICRAMVEEFVNMQLTAN